MAGMGVKETVDSVSPVVCVTCRCCLRYLTGKASCARREHLVADMMQQSSFNTGQ